MKDVLWNVFVTLVVVYSRSAIKHKSNTPTA